jgi:hypothetical protein
MPQNGAILEKVHSALQNELEIVAKNYFRLSVTLRIVWQKFANYLAIFSSAAKIRM